MSGAPGHSKRSLSARGHNAPHMAPLTEEQNSTYVQLLNMGFDDIDSHSAARKHGNNFPKALDFCIRVAAFTQTMEKGNTKKNNGKISNDSEDINVSYDKVIEMMGLNNTSGLGKIGEFDELPDYEAAKKMVVRGDSAERVLDMETFSDTDRELEIDSGKMKDPNLYTARTELAAFELEQQHDESSSSCWERFTEWGNEKFENMRFVYCSICIFCVGFLLILILVPLSFATLPEEFLGYLKHDYTKRIKFDRVYGPGHHNSGPLHNFIDCDKRTQSLKVFEATSWTCPEDINGACIEEIYLNNSTENNIGAEIKTDFYVFFRIIQEKWAVHAYYDLFAFDDHRVSKVVDSLANENARQTPQHQSVSEIVEFTEANTQIILNQPALNAEVNEFGFQITDILISAFKLGDHIVNKYFTIELRRYEDDIVLITEESRVIERETETEIELIQNEANKEAIELRSYANAYQETLIADGEAYQTQTRLNATQALAEMFKRKFPSSNKTEIMDFVSLTGYVQKISKIEDATSMLMNYEEN